MKATELIKTIQNIVDAEGDLEVDISVLKQDETNCPVLADQQYLIACAEFVDVQEYSKKDGGPKISIRDWAY